MLSDPAPDGLAAMTAARVSRTRRTMPPSRHPVAPSDEVPVEATRVPRPTAQPNPLSPAAGRVYSVPEPVAQEPSPPVASGESATESLSAKTLYLGASHIRWLQDVRIAALTERVDVSESAVVRLALRRLMQEMTVEQIRDHLRDQPSDGAKTGRKRR